MRPIGWAVAVSMMAAPALAGERDGGYDPCRNQGTRRLAIVYAPSSGLLGGSGECKGNVYPEKKVVCEGDAVEWSIINTCDVEAVSDIRLEGLERVTERCTTVRQLGVGAARSIRCKVRRRLGGVKQEYEVRGRIGRSRMVIDPELDIREPQ
jgi:hypothetical protein